MTPQRIEQKEIISFFGYPTYEAYRTARLKTAHTPGLLKEFNITEEEHIALLQPLIKRRVWESVIKYVEAVWENEPNAYAGCSLGWYFHHPEMRKHIPVYFLRKHDSLCGPMKLIYGEDITL